MSILSPKRVIQFLVASLLGTALYANHPSPRLYPAMAYDERANAGVLFGGRASSDPAIGLIPTTDETWFWTANQWVQQFPATHPPARSTHSMTYDSKRGRVILFGGRREATVVQEDWTYFDDTWAWQDGQWQKIVTATAPEGREFAGLTYDRDRDKVILFGGYRYKPGTKTRALEALHDTWEFDGTNWTRVNETGPSVDKPLLVFDAARHETIMVGIGNTIQTLMTRWDPDSKTWQAETPAALPPCVNEAGLVYQTHNERVVLAGGLCLTTASQLDETWEWDGDNWTKLTTTATTRYTGSAITYDVANQKVVRYGGVIAFSSTPDSSTWIYGNLVWRFMSPIANPSARSLPVFRRDPVRNSLWLMGGLSEYSGGETAFYYDDLWRFQGGIWYQELNLTGMPSQCQAPLSAFDTDRAVTVVVCGDGRIVEWNGSTWKSFTDLSKEPDPRRFAGLVYDQTLKLTVYFGGYDGTDYRDDTWTWNGTAWTKVKTKDDPENRGQMAIWYDPLAKKTILFSGIGRPNIDSKVTRFNDMWSFDGANWVKMSVTQTPGIRFGSQVAVDPRDGKVVLFGGLRATVEGKLVDQFYDNDVWTWDGAASKWTEIATTGGPSARENAGFDFDPSLNKFVLFGGFAANFYFSDVWTWDGQSWVVIPDRVTSHRRRATRP
jgi:N-acetylneuraminic acid mutarotase